MAYRCVIDVSGGIDTEDTDDRTSDDALAQVLLDLVNLVRVESKESPE